MPVLAFALMAALQTASAPVSADVIFSRACVETQGDRRKLADLARAEGWTPTTPPEDQVSQPNAWADAWALDGVTIFLVNYSGGTTGGATARGPSVRMSWPTTMVCGTTGPASLEWRQNLTRDAATLALPTPRIAIIRPAADDHQSATWGNLFDGLNGEYRRSTNRLEVRRPFPAPTSSAQ